MGSFFSDPNNRRTFIVPFALGSSLALNPDFLALAGFLWGKTGLAVGLAFVPAQKLSERAIPHLIAARKILGDTGRIIMGLTIIFGSLAGIHALFTDIVHRVKDLAERKIIPEKLNRPKTVIILLTLTTGLMMGLGLAGSDVLETLIRFSLILWFLSHVAVWLYIKPDRS